MKLMLVNTPIEQASILGNFSAIYNDLKMIPTGLAYLASSARAHGIDVAIIDQYAECLSARGLEARIRSFAPDMIGFGATTPNYTAALALLKLVRKAFPKLKTVMGGNHPSIFPEAVLECQEVDFVLRGESEESLPKLCNALVTGVPFDDIPSLSYRAADGYIRHNPLSPEPLKLDTLPWPAYDLLPMAFYSSPSYTKFAHPVFQMIASRGCPNNCSYCINAAEPKIGAAYRRRPVDDVLDEMEMLINNYGAMQIQFWDPIFPLGKKHALEFCDKLMKRGLHKQIVWSSTTYADLLDEVMIDAMAKSGCRGLGFGIESGVVELLRSVNKRSDLAKVRDVCRMARKRGITVLGAFIIGFPGETVAMTRQTIDYAKSLDLHYAQFSILVPYPGTPLYQHIMERGELKHIDDSELVRFNQSIGLTENELIYVPAGRSSDELKEWQRKAYQEFYLRPKTVWLHLPHLRLKKVPQLLKSLMAVLNLSLNHFLKVVCGGKQEAANKDVCP